LGKKQSPCNGLITKLASNLYKSYKEEINNIIVILLTKIISSTLIQTKKN